MMSIFIYHCWWVSGVTLLHRRQTLKRILRNDSAVANYMCTLDRSNKVYNERKNFLLWWQWQTPKNIEIFTHFDSASMKDDLWLATIILNSFPYDLYMILISLSWKFIYFRGSFKNELLKNTIQLIGDSDGKRQLSVHFTGKCTLRQKCIEEECEDNVTWDRNLS